MNNFFVNNRPMTVRDWAIDVAVAALAFSFGCVQLMVTASSIIIPDLAFRQYLGVVNVVPTVGAFIALAFTTVPLVLRRRLPWPTFLFCIAAYLAFQNEYSGLSLTVIGPAVALYTIAVEAGLGQAAIAAGISVVGILLTNEQLSSPSLVFFTRFQNVVIMVAAALAGYAYRAHLAYVRATEERALAAERSREEEAARRVEEERVRIAREVHDITAHSLSAVSIQAAAAERLIDRNPAAAKQAIATVRSTSKTALDDIRSMIGVLRQGDEGAETVPTGGTERLSDVVTFLESAGITVQLDTAAYDRARVPAHVDMALYGIVREAATNIVRHSGASRAAIRLASSADAASLDVRDNGRGNFATKGTGPLPASADGQGHGIAGMAERVHLLGGTLEAGGLPQGGFEVEARIPLQAKE